MIQLLFKGAYPTNIGMNFITAQINRFYFLFVGQIICQKTYFLIIKIAV